MRSTSLPTAQALPRPNAQGEYTGRTLWLSWRAADPDPAGLNGRRHPDFPVGREDDISLDWPTSPVMAWPVVRRIPRGTTLRGVCGNLGVIRLTDPDGRGWQLVALPDGEHVFVRCNARFITPAQP